MNALRTWFAFVALVAIVMGFACLKVCLSK